MTSLPIPVLTLWEPWGSLIAAGLKRHETRHWPTNRRGPVAIHAAKKVVLDVDPELDALCTWAFGGGWRRTRPLGCVLAIADLTDCVSAYMLTLDACLSDPPKDHLRPCDELAGDYSDGRFGFQLDNVRPLICPLPLKSRQTPFWPWTPPADLSDRLLPAVDHFAASDRWEARHAA